MNFPINEMVVTVLAVVLFGGLFALVWFAFWLGDPTTNCAKSTGGSKNRQNLWASAKIVES